MATPDSKCIRGMRGMKIFKTQSNLDFEKFDIGKKRDYDSKKETFFIAIKSLNFEKSK